MFCLEYGLSSSSARDVDVAGRRDGSDVADPCLRLLGRYDGAHAIERAFNDFKAGKLENNTTGVMIHYVIEEVDRGQAIMTQEVQCREGETLEQLEGRIHGVEHELIVEATAKVAAEAVERKSRR
jgi:phosphoribosylglycinamide formyltransferase